MSISHLLDQAIIWLLWSALGLGILTIICFISNWGVRFRLVGATIFTLLLSGSCWAFAKSYSPPETVEGAIYLPVVYDNGYDLVIAQANDDFPREAIKPTLEQIAGNLKGGSRNGAEVHIKIRALKLIDEGISQPIVLGEAIRDINQDQTITLIKEEKQIDDIQMEDSIDEVI